MELSLPIACRPAAFNLFRQQLDQLQSNRGLLRAALAISMHELPQVQPAEVGRRVARLSGRVRNRVRGHQRQALMAHLHDELFQRRNFRGNADNYYLASNSYLPTVLETGLGIPISLSLICAPGGLSACSRILPSPRGICCSRYITRSTLVTIPTNVRSGSTTGKA